MIFLLLNVHLQPISVLPSTISFKTHSRLNSTSFVKEDILKIIRNLNFNKACGHDDISIQMNVKNMLFWSSWSPITYL